MSQSAIFGTVMSDVRDADYTDMWLGFSTSDMDNVLIEIGGMQRFKFKAMRSAELVYQTLLVFPRRPIRAQERAAGIDPG